MDSSAMFRLTYGLFVLTAREKDKDNGCIINTVMQITDTPKRILIAVNKGNYTHDMIRNTGEFNVSVLTEDTPFSVFQQFGFCSGRECDKFAEAAIQSRTQNGIRCVCEHSNAVISGKVVKEYDYETHTVFVADVTDAIALSSAPSVTYQYYFDHIKPKGGIQNKNSSAQNSASKENSGKAKKRGGFICRICGYVYEGEELPKDYVCPICKHGAEDFEKYIDK